VEHDTSQQSKGLKATPVQKRKLGATDFEIADSDDEDYGLDDDEELPPMPSQWQGSEDILLVRNPESDDDDTLDNDQASDAIEDDDQDADGAKTASDTERLDREATP
jgi:hypothetical protein